MLQHPANPFNSPEFREELCQVLDEKLQPILEIKTLVDRHEITIQRMRGGMIVLAAIWAAVHAILLHFVLDTLGLKK